MSEYTRETAMSILKMSFILVLVGMVGAFLLGIGLGLSTWAIVGLMLLTFSAGTLYTIT